MRIPCQAGLSNETRLATNRITATQCVVHIRIAHTAILFRILNIGEEDEK